MKLDYPTIIEYLYNVDRAPVISLLLRGIEKLKHQLNGEILPQFDQIVLRGYDPLKDYKLRDQEYSGGIYSWDRVTHTQSHLLGLLAGKQNLPPKNRERELQQFVARIKYDQENMGNIGPDFADYRLRRTAIHLLQDAAEEIPAFLHQAELNPLLAMFDCSSHLQTNEKSLYLAKVMLEGRIEEVKSLGGEHHD